MSKLDPVWAHVQRPSQSNGQSKKMKKRKELDALLGNRGCSAYEQFRRVDGHAMVSSSSREGDIYFQQSSKHFSTLPKRSGKRISSKSGGCTSKRLFCLCLPICVLALIAACVTSSIGIVWMQMQLKADMELIKDRILKLELWKDDEPASLADVQASLASLMHDLTDLREGNTGVRAANTKIAMLADQMETLPKVQQLVGKEDIDKLENRLSKMQRTVHDTSSAAVQIASKHSIMSAAVDGLRAKTQSLEGAVQEITTRIHQDSEVEATNSTLHLIMDRLLALETSLFSMEGSDRQKATATLYEHLSQGISSVNTTVLALKDRSKRMLARLEAIETRLAVIARETKIGEKMFEESHDSTGEKTSHPDGDLGGDAIASSSDKTSHRIGDTTTSFTQSPVRPQGAT